MAKESKSAAKNTSEPKQELMWNSCQVVHLV